MSERYLSGEQPLVEPGRVGRRAGALGVVVAALLLTLSVLPVPAMAASQFGNLQEGGPAEGTEQVNFPVGVAVDATGDVYVGDFSNNRVDKFDGSGNWILAWGAGVLNGAPEMQTCTTLCQGGRQTTTPEAFELPTGVAVDNDPLSSSYGDVYVVNEFHDLVEKFDSSGKFLLMFGGRVNATTGEDVCRAGEVCKLYAETGPEDGEFSYMTAGGFNSFIAVGPGGAVYVGDQARVEVFEPSGAWKENISISPLSGEGHPTALAVDAAGDMYLKDSEVPGVRELEPNGTEKPVRFDEGSESVDAIALDPAGDVFVSDSGGGFHINEYDASGKQLANFAAHTVSGKSGGLAFSSTTDELYASESHEYWEPGEQSIWRLPLPEPGPIIDSTSATPELRGAATLEAQVDPEGAETTVHIDYVDDAHYAATGYASATSTAPVSINANFEDQTVSAHPTLVPGTLYHFRVVASSASNTTAVEGQSFQDTPPAEILGPWASDVAGTSATISARIDPLGADTTYRVEYGTTASYGEVISGSVGEGMGFMTISHHLQGLEAAATYHYRIVTSSAVGTWQSADRTFTTQPASGELALPDGRQWELVSPVNKHGQLIEPELFAPEYPGVVQAADDGSGITYQASGPVTETAPASTSYISQVLSRRTAGGWRSEEIGLPVALGEEEGQRSPELITFLPPIFSADLSLGVIEPSFSVPPFAKGSERTLYLRNNDTGNYLPLVSASNVEPSGTPYGGSKEAETGMEYLFATPDLRHILFRSPLALTENAKPGVCASEGQCSAFNLYEWNEGKLDLINLLPDREAYQPTDMTSERGEGDVGLGRYNLSLGHDAERDVQFSVTPDGRFVVWSQGAATLQPRQTHTLYVRDMVTGESVAVGGPFARFDKISLDGSMLLALYWEKGELYADALQSTDLQSSHTTDITEPHLEGEKRAGVVDSQWMGISADGSYVYFVATGVLAAGAKSGEDNLYLAHYDGSEWTTALVATLSKSDEYFCGGCIGTSIEFAYQDSRVSPSGQYLAFMSGRSLTGYDNADAISGEPDKEIYLYDAKTGKLVCTSCDPSGARPVGVNIGNAYINELMRPMVDRQGAWREQWLAAILPPWRESNNAVQYQERFLSNSGRLFFNSFDSLTPQDTNGVTDVYEYEPAGIGSCGSASSTYVSSEGGCVSLISPGTSSAESGFMDASEDGNDVFFATQAKLVTEDKDTSYDIYDAHVCTAEVPCQPDQATPPPCTSGDSCKGAPAPQPESFGPAPSQTFNGSGNVGTHVSKIGGPPHKPARCRRGTIRRLGRCVKAKRRRHRKKAKHARHHKANHGTRRGK